MSKVIIPLNAFDRTEVLEKGQESFVESIAQSGAYGIEIRRELILEGELPLERVRKEIEKYHLFTVYSAPVELWLEDGSLNKEILKRTFAEAKTLCASWVKTSLGQYQEGISNCLELNEFLTDLENGSGNIKLLVENDQTMYGGNVARLTAFFRSADQLEVPVKMTFDTGNWHYVNQNVEIALNLLAKYVCYLHFKHVEKNSEGLVTLPLPDNSQAEWRKILQHFPTDIVKALEFPIEKVDEIQHYIEMVEAAAIEERRRMVCKS